MKIALIITSFLLVGSVASAQSTTADCTLNQNMIPGTNDISCSAESALDDLSPPDGICDPNETEEDKKLKPEEKITGGASVDPSVGALTDRYNKWAGQNMSTGRAVLPLDTNDHKQIKSQLESDKGFGEFTNLVNQALTPEASAKLQKTIDAENAASLQNLRTGFKDIMRKTEGYPKADRDQIVSGYLEKFFDETYDPKKTRECFTDREAYHLGDTTGSAFKPVIGNQTSKSISNKVANFGDGKNLSTQGYDDAGKIFDKEVADKINFKTQNASLDYDVIYTKDYRNFESSNKKACPDKKEVGPVDQGSHFADNHYYTNPGSENYLSNELSELKTALDKKWNVGNLYIESSCSKVTNTPEPYKKVDIAKGKPGMDADLTNFEKDVFPYIEDKDREEWRLWLKEFREKIAKEKPTSEFKISFEDLSRLRSLKIASDLMKGEPRLKDNLDQTGQKFVISWEGKSGDGTSGDPYDSTSKSGIVEKLTKELKRKPTEVEYKAAYEKKYSPSRYNQLSFKVESVEQPIEKDSKGKGYFARDTFLVQCGVQDKDRPHRSPSYSPYRRPHYKGTSSKKIQRRHTPSNGRNSGCKSPGMKRGHGFWSSSNMNQWGR
jgi:hypothetical protein